MKPHNLDEAFKVILDLTFLGLNSWEIAYRLGFYPDDVTYFLNKIFTFNDLIFEDGKYKFVRR